MYNDKWFIMDEEEIKQPPKSKRDIVIERLRAKYPDSPLEGDEDIFEMIDTDYSANESREAERKANNDKLSNLFMKNPRFGAFFMELLNSEDADPGIVFVKHFGKDILSSTDDEESMQKIIEANEEYANRMKRNEELAEEQKSNLENSEPVLKAFQEEKGLSDDEMNALIDDICNGASNIFMGIFTSDVLESAWKSKNYDTNIAQAEMEGEVRGKNEKINELKKKTTVPEGIPASVVGKNKVQEPQSETNPTVKWLDELQAKKNKRRF